MMASVAGSRVKKKLKFTVKFYGSCTANPKGRAAPARSPSAVSPGPSGRSQGPAGVT